MPTLLEAFNKTVKSFNQGHPYNGADRFEALVHEDVTWNSLETIAQLSPGKANVIVFLNGKKKDLKPQFAETTHYELPDPKKDGSWLVFGVATWTRDSAKPKQTRNIAYRFTFEDGSRRGDGPWLLTDAFGFFIDPKPEK